MIFYRHILIASLLLSANFAYADIENECKLSAIIAPQIFDTDIEQRKKDPSIRKHAQKVVDAFDTVYNDYGREGLLVVAALVEYDSEQIHMDQETALHMVNGYLDCIGQ